MAVGMQYIFFMWLVLAMCAEAEPKKVAKRSDDASPLEVVVNRLSQDLAKVQADLEVLKNQQGKRVAFFAMAAGNATSLITASAGAPIDFSSVSFNIGDAFDRTLGIFTAPVPGVYIFTYQIYTVFNGDKLVDLMKNGHLVARTRMTFEDDSHHEPASEASAVVQYAQAGDKFWVEINQSGRIEFGPHCFFSGTLVSPGDQ